MSDTLTFRLARALGLAALLALSTPIDASAGGLRGLVSAATKTRIKQGLKLRRPSAASRSKA